MHNPFNQLALYAAYKAGLLTWQALPLTTQVALVRASAAASLTQYAATLTPHVAQWCNNTTAATGGKLTGKLPTVHNYVPANQSSNALAVTGAYRKAG